MMIFLASPCYQEEGDGGYSELGGRLSFPKDERAVPQWHEGGQAGIA